jgi:hypothetical protein
MPAALPTVRIHFLNEKGHTPWEQKEKSGLKEESPLFIDIHKKSFDNIYE